MPAREDHHAALLHVANGTAADVGLAHRLHADRREHAGRDPQPLQRALHGQRIDDGGEHPHIVRRRPLDAARGTGQAAKDVAATDHQADLDAEPVNFLHFSGDARNDARILAILPLAHQGLAGDLQEDAPVFQVRWHGLRDEIRLGAR